MAYPWELAGDDPLNYGLIQAGGTLMTPEKMGGGMGPALSRFGQTVSNERQNLTAEELKRLAIEARKRELIIKPQQKFIPLGNGMIFNAETQEILTGPEKPEKPPAQSAEMQLVNAMFPEGHPQRMQALQALHQKHSTHAPFAPQVQVVPEQLPGQPPSQAIIDHRTGGRIGALGARPQPAADARDAKAAGAAKVEEDKLKTIAEDLASARLLLPGATGSGAGTLVDKALGLVGESAQSTRQAARLKAIGARLSLNTPRFEGPQGVRDVEIYAEMVGKIGDSTIPVEVRQEALKEVERILIRNKPDASVTPEAPAANRGFKVIR